MDETLIGVAQRDGVLRLTLNRPEKRNALTGAMYDALPTRSRAVVSAPFCRSSRAESPKSMIVTRCSAPTARTMMLSLFRSRCSTPDPCAACKPERICRASPRTVGTASGSERAS